MKKIIALLVLFSLSLTLFACKKADDEKDSAGKTPEASSSQTQGSTDNKSETKPVSSEIKKGDKGKGPADVDAYFISFKLPAGYSYEVDSFSKDQKDKLKGDVSFYIYKDGDYSILAQLTATARNMVDSREKAVENTIKLCNLQSYKEGKSEVGSDITFGDYTYSPIKVSTEYGVQNYFVTYVNRGETDKNGLLVKFNAKEDKIKADDPFIKELLDSLKVTME